MAIFWSSKGDRVKRLLVRRCSHSAQQRQREQLNAGLAVGHPKYPLECTLPSYRFHHVEARSCTRAKPELAAAVLTHLRRFVKPSLGGKAFKSEPPIVFFPLDPKKRHLHWATWSIFGSSETGGLSEDPKKRHLPERQNRRSFGFAVYQAVLALALCSTRESRRSRRYRASRLGVHPNFPPLCTSHRV
jgi:hypothetical protein